MAAKRGVKNVVLSPGSRNAPLAIAFSRNPALHLHVAVDERNAAFMALGIWQASRQPVLLCCTSGTALLNYAPAVAEAFYQDAALIIVSADRPPEKIDMGEGQTIRQPSVFANFCRFNYQLPVHVDSAAVSEVVHILETAFHNVVYPHPNPVHINVPFEEPLYQLTDDMIEFWDFQVENLPSESDILPLEQALLKARKPMLLVGQQHHCGLPPAMRQAGWVVLAETTSNTVDVFINRHIDRTLSALPAADIDTHPDVLITLGTNIISKRIKQWLGSVKGLKHWHVDTGGRRLDTFGCLQGVIRQSDLAFLNTQVFSASSTYEDYPAVWAQSHEKGRLKHAGFLSQAPFSDLSVFDLICELTPLEYHLQSGNSSVIRYFQLFDRKWERCFSNRGTSGIEGSLSVAVGYAISTEAPVLCVLGDLSFQYDIHGLWQKEIPANLRIVVVNNGGGGIFRYIGNTGLPEFETLFETHHSLTAEHIARHYDLPYASAKNLKEARACLTELFREGGGCSILEIFTPRLENAEVLKSYFRFIEESSE